MSDFCNSKEVVTRKLHICEWCYWPISKGEKCTYASGHFDGAMYSYHMHNECWKECCADPDNNLDGFMPGLADPPERVRMEAAANGL